MSRASRFIPFLLLTALAENATSTTYPLVDLGYAQYQGILPAGSDVTQFLGIRYAAPPTGALRWQGPRDPSIIEGVQKADSQPPSCLQAPYGSASKNFLASTDDICPAFLDPESQHLDSQAAMCLPSQAPSEAAFHDAGTSASEDCLFLNVWTPGPFPIRRRLPVVVWIHGGGYHLGGATGLLGLGDFNGEDLVRASGNQVVAVVIQYRLGLWGFLAGSEVKAGGALNAGLLDQESALRWIQKHITKFGGDPTQVTIWGESAGAGSVLQQVVAHDGKTNPPLFRAAMLSSSFLPPQYNYNDRIPETLYQEVLTRTNCLNAHDTLECLRQTDVDVLQSANAGMGGDAFFGTFIWVPVVDGTFIVRRITESLKQGKVNTKHLLAITNTVEGLIFVDQTLTGTVSEYLAELFPELGPTQIAAAARQYEHMGTTTSQANAIMGEAIFVCPSYYALEAFEGSAFKGEFAVPPALHGQDSVYYFPSQHGFLGEPYNNTDFRKAFAQSFLNFVASLDPNTKLDPTSLTPRWAKWGPEVAEMVFSKTDVDEPLIQPVKTSTSLLERCRFWETVTKFTAQ